jgi:hypothetical protein
MRQLPLPQGRFLVFISVSGRIDLFRNRTDDLLACSIMPQPTTLPCDLFIKNPEILFVDKLKWKRKIIW